MGVIIHDAVIMVTSGDSRPGGLPDVEGFRNGLPKPWRRLVIGPIPGVINNDRMYAFLPDGSKEVWRDSNAGDQYRAEFVALFDQQYDDGSSHDDGVAVRFGPDIHGNGEDPQARRVGGGYA